MPYRKHRAPKPCPPRQAAQNNFPEVRNRYPDQGRRDNPEETMAEGRGSRHASPPERHPSSPSTPQQYHHRQPYVRPTQQYYEHRSYEPRPGPEGRHPHYPERPVYSDAKRMVRDRYHDQCDRDDPEETMAEGRESRYSTPPGRHRSFSPTQPQYQHRQPYVRPTQQYHEHRSYEPRPGPEGRHPHYPERPVYSGAKRMVHDRYPDQRGRDDPEETMAEGRESRYSMPPGRHPSSPPNPQQVHDRYPDQRGRDDPEETMAEGRGSRYSTPPGRHPSSPSTPQQYHHRQPYVRPTQQYHEHRNYEPRPGPEGRHPHYPERPVYSDARRMVHDRYPDQRGRDDPEETMAEGRESRYSTPPGRHPSSPPNPQQVHDRYPDQRGRDDPEETIAEGRESRYSTPPGRHPSSPSSPQQYHHRQPYVRPTQQYHEHRNYEPRPGPEGRHPHYPERPVYSDAKRMVHDRYPDQRGRDDPEETMAEGRGSRHASPPERHPSSPSTPQQYHHRQPYVRPTQQYHEHRSYEPRPGPEGRHPHYPERPVYSGAKRMVRDRYPDQRVRDDPEETMAEGRESRYSTPPGGHRSSPPTQPQVHDRYPDQRDRDDPEETMAEGRGSRHASPPGGHRSSPPTQPQYRHRQPYVRPTQQYHEHRSYEPRPGPEVRHPHYPERPVYSDAKRMIRDRDHNQRGRDVTEETMADGRESRYTTPPGRHSSSPPTPQQVHDRYPDRRGRDHTEEVMAEGRESRHSTPPGPPCSSPPTQPQHSKRPGKQTPKAVDPTSQAIVMNKKGASDTKPGPVDVPKLKQAAQRSPSPGLVKKSGNAWNPAMRRQSIPVEKESHITQDLFRKVRSILNKLTPQKFIQLRNQLLDLTINTEERLKGVVDLLYERAINEQSFLVTYAKMCGCLATLIVPTAENPVAKVNFHKLLLRSCQKEFQKEKVDDVAFETKPKVLDSAASTERDRLQVEPEEAKDITQKRFIGNIMLLCEMFKLNMLNDFIVHDCLEKLLRNNDEVALECLCILLNTISKGHNCDETKMVNYLNHMEDIVREGKTSSQIHSMLEETIKTIDLTLPNLVSRNAVQGPKPGQEVHNKEAHEEQKEPVDGPKLHRVGRRSSSPGLVTPAAPMETPEAPPTPPASDPELPLPASLSPRFSPDLSPAEEQKTSLAPPNPPTKDEPLLDEPSTALSVAAPEALNSLAETRTELETAGHEPSHDVRPQDPTPPQCPNSEATIPLKSRSSSGKRGRKGRKRHNKPPYAGSPR